MLIRNKSFPYPVIAQGNDSYENSSFLCDIKAECDGYKIRFKTNTVINNDVVKELVKEKKAIIVHHVECVQTCYRNAFVTDESDYEFLIHQSKLNGTVQINSVIVANENIERYKNPDFSSDYKGFSFNIKKGCLLAIGPYLEIQLDKQRDDFENSSSIFSIVPILDENEDIIVVDVNSTKAKIVIRIPVKSYNIYKNLGGNIELQSVMHSMIIIPALMKVFEELKSEDLFDFHDCKWFKSLKKACESQNIILDENSIKNIDSYTVAQKLMDTPTIRALDYLAGGSEYEA